MMEGAMDRYRDTTEAEDARHNTPPTQRQNPFIRTQQEPTVLVPAEKESAFRRSTLNETVTHHAPLAPGLHFIPDNGPALRDLGRIDWADNAHTGGARVDTLTLRVIEAHMVEAQARLRDELNRRRRGATFGPVGPDIDE